jgi:hypothetical protein
MGFRFKKEYPEPNLLLIKRERAFFKGNISIRLPVNREISLGTGF